MKGNKRKGRSPGTWELRVDAGEDPLTRKRQQKSVTFHGTSCEADIALAELFSKSARGQVSVGQRMVAHAIEAGLRERAVELRAEAPVKTFVARVLGVHTDERAYRVGADGEEEVAWRMRKLGDGWHVIHSVPVGEKGSDIDHVVIGPAGVFTLNTKNHLRKKVWIAEKAFMVSGQKTNYLRNSRREASRASKLLTAAYGYDVPVEPIIVVIAAELSITAQPTDVHVIARKRIGKWLQRRPSTLSPSSVEAIYEMARRDTTWRTA